MLDTVFKLVAFDGRPVRKTSEGKATWPGRKQVWRSEEIDVLGLADEDGPAGGEALMDEVMRNGRRTAAGQADLAGAAARFARQWDGLGRPVRRLSDPVSRPLRLSAALERLTAEVDARRTRLAGEEMA